MLNLQQTEELCSFFEKYCQSMRGVAEDEKEKLNALISNSLPRIENAITTAQANAKLIESLETKRNELQSSMGCAGLTLTQLSAEAHEEKRAALIDIFARLNRCVDEIKFTNDKSMETAKANIVRINPEAAILRQNEAASAPNAAYGAALATKNQSRTIFKTTV